MKKVNMSNHEFIPISIFSPNDRGETWWKSYKCKHCGIKGRRYSVNESFVYVTDSFSDNRINNCVKDNFIDKYVNTQIQICCKIYDYPQIPIYSIHTVVAPLPEQFLNGEGGVYIKVKEVKEPVQILFSECVSYPILPRQKLVIRRTKKAGHPKVIPPYMKIKHVRTKKPVKFTRTKITIKPIKRTRTK